MQPLAALASRLAPQLPARGVAVTLVIARAGLTSPPLSHYLRRLCRACRLSLSALPLARLNLLSFLLSLARTRQPARPSPQDTTTLLRFLNCSAGKRQVRHGYILAFTTGNWNCLGGSKFSWRPKSNCQGNDSFLDGATPHSRKHIFL